MAALTLVRAFAALGWVVALRSPGVHIDQVGAYMFAIRYVYPLLAIAALVLLRRGTRLGTRLGLAGTLALTPTGLMWLYYIILFVLFSIDSD